MPITPHQVRSHLQAVLTRFRIPLTLLLIAISITLIVLATLSGMTATAPKAHAIAYVRTPVSAAHARIAAQRPISNVQLVLTPTKGMITLNWYSSDPTAGYLVGATAVKASRTTLQKVTNRAVTFRDLDERLPYLFTITPMHGDAVGPRSTIQLRHSLAGIRALALVPVPIQTPTSSPSATVTPVSTPTTTPTPTPSVAAVHAAPPQAPQPPAPQPPAPQPTPSTRTVYSCPSDFTEVAGVCTQYRAYAFHTERRTSPYTFHTEFVETSRTWRDFGTDWSGTLCPNGGTMHSGHCVGWDVQGVNVSVKDAPPTGWLDDGTTYVKDEQVRDALPEGFADDGTRWVRTTARIATEVPA